MSHWALTREMSCRTLTSPSPGALLAFKTCEHYRNWGVLTRQKGKYTSDSDKQYHFHSNTSSKHLSTSALRLKSSWRMYRVMEGGNRTTVRYSAGVRPRQRFCRRVRKHDRRATGNSRARQKVRNVVGAGGRAWTMHWNSCRSTSAMLRVDEQEGSRAWYNEEKDREGKKGERETNRREKRRGLRESRPG